jgi:hypothetical protein
MGKQKVEMKVSIASADWSYQPGQVVLLDKDLAAKWIRGGHAVAVNGSLPLTDFNSLDGLADLDAEQAMTYACIHCPTRASYVLRQRPLCKRHFVSEMEG